MFGVALAELRQEQQPGQTKADRWSGNVTLPFLLERADCGNRYGLSQVDNYYATGCSGFNFLVGTAGSLLFSSPEKRPIVCVMADCMPPGVPDDMVEERILGSDHSSAFIVGREQCGYQLRAVSYYSSTRTMVPFAEVVKQTVEMIKDLATTLQIDLSGSDVAVHYPNIFPDTWKMVTRYLRIPNIEHVLYGMAERAHCMASALVISLTNFIADRRDAFISQLIMG